MSNHQFPSGPWVGFYIYAGRSRKHPMDLLLEFKNGQMTGEGADDIGSFVISGNYSDQDGDCSWVKQYVGRHAVEYKGFQDGKGIWGNWLVGRTKGGFHIWPLSEGAPLKAVAKSATEKKAASTIKPKKNPLPCCDGSWHVVGFHSNRAQRTAP